MKKSNSSFKSSTQLVFGILMAIAGGILCIIGSAFSLAGMLVSKFTSFGAIFGAVPLLLLAIGVILLVLGIRRILLFTRYRKLSALPEAPLPLEAVARELNRTPAKFLSDLRIWRTNGSFSGVDVQPQAVTLCFSSRAPLTITTDAGLVFQETSGRSLLPVYAVGVVWLVYAAFFPLYRWTDFIIAGAVSAIVYVLLAGRTPQELHIKQKKPTLKPAAPPIKTGDEQIDELLRNAGKEVAALEGLALSFASEPVQQQIKDLSATANQILEFLQKKPEKARQVRQFLHYYLPSSLKLLTTYQEFGSEDVKGDNIRASMKKIEELLPGMQRTFADELDGLYRDQAIDISAEVSVMRNMIVQEGIGDSPASK